MWSLPTWAAQEGNEGLYEMAAPPDSAFVRVVNLTSGQLELAMDEWRQSLAPGRAGDYLYRPGGDAQLQVNGQPFAFSFAARSVQTLAYDGERLTAFEDTYFNSRLKALVVMYNLVAQGASLQTANGAVTVIGPLAASESADREINGVKVALRVSLDDGASLPLDEAVLQRGRVYSVWVVAGESGPQARLEEANVATMP